jgi:RNA polymerase sigma-70 factor (ECF subfamily)
VPFRAWLLRIATNRANLAARRERVRRRVLGRLVPVSPAARATDMGELHDALGRLRAEHQAVISLVHLEGLSIEQTAQVLGVAEGTVKSRLHRARQALRGELMRTGGYP